MKYHKIFILACFLVTSIAHAGLVGDFSHTRNLPGYIDLSPHSAAYKGPYTRTVEYGDGVITDTPSKMVAKLFQGSTIDVSKIRQMIYDLKRLQENARIAYCQAEQAEDNLTQQGCREGFPRKKLKKKWKKKSVNIAYKFAIKRFEEAIALAPTINVSNINSKSSQPFLEAFFDGIEIFQGVMQEDSQVARYSGVVSAYLRFKDAIRPITITKQRMEAANLLRVDGDPTRLFYSPEELEQLKQRGMDISLLNPPDSGFWKKPKQSIRNYVTTNYSGEEVAYFQKELSAKQIDDLLDPKVPLNVSYRIYVPKGTGETPKIYVQYGKSTLKVKFTTDRIRGRKTTDPFHEALKIARGMEVNTETVVNNLAAALGFAVDGTYYKDVVKVFFEDEVYESGKFDDEYKRMYEILTKRYDAIYNPGSALKNVKVDPESGRKYIELKHVQLERKSEVDTDMNIGFFVRKGLGKSLKREHRAYALFLAWIWDVDTKDANNSLKLVPIQDTQGNTRYKIVMSNSDMGSTLGANRPNLYNFRLIRHYQSDENGDPTYIRFNYPRVYPNDLMDAITFADAKWMARLIGQLTEKQIYEAHVSAGYPPVVGKYLAGLMLQKRNQLLKALNLIGDTFVNAAGETITLEKSWEFNGSLPGHEEFFRQGFLTDPDNKLFDPKRDAFPKYWGAGIKNFKGEPQEYFVKLLRLRLLTTAGNILYSSVLRDVSLSNQGLSFNEMGMSSTSEVNDCSGKCFFQGFAVGVERFIPWRFIIDNPNPESQAPFLLIDMFRLGFFAGHNLQKAFGVDIPGNLMLGIGAKHYQITEFIKVRPIDDIEEFYRKGSDLLKMPKLYFKSARKQVIENLKENEVLIQSHYIGLRSGAKLQNNVNSFMPISPSITFAGDMMAVNRVTFMAQAKQKMLAGWSRVKQLAANFRLNLFDFIVNIPVVEAELRKMKSIEKTFEFDMSKERDRAVMFANLNKIIPSDVPQEYALAQRSLNQFQTTFSAGVFNLYRRTAYKKSLRVDFKDFLTQYEGSNINYIREIKRQRVTRRLGTHQSTYKIQASLNSQNEIYAKVKLTGKFADMTKYKFRNLLHKYTPMLPPNFIQFDPMAVNENFGILDMNIETIFSEKALKEIFDNNVSKFALCQKYSTVHGHDWSESECRYLSSIRFVMPWPFQRRVSIAKKHFVQIWRKYESARFAFWNLWRAKERGGPPSFTNDSLKKITEVLEDNGDYDYQSMNLFLSMAQQKDYYRRASMYSTIEAFPGQTDYISQDVTAAGTYSPSNGMLSDSPAEEFELFMDSIHEAIRNIFFNEQLVTDNLPGQI